VHDHDPAGLAGGGAERLDVEGNERAGLTLTPRGRLLGGAVTAELLA